jgi:Bax protein
MILKYPRDIYFLMITLFLFAVGFTAPIDQKSDRFFSLKKNYENNLKYLKKSKTVSTVIKDQQINNNSFVLQWSKKILTQAEKKYPISREFFLYIPNEINDNNTTDKKDIFISILLPIALRGNEIVLEERELIKNIFKNNDISGIQFFSKKYKVQNYKNINFTNLSDKQLDKLKSELMVKVNTIPISMILAQAIIESGWGTSRFAREGNALFGEWTWQKNTGIKPLQKLNANYSVKSFTNITESLNSYILNLNKHDAYKEMRSYRHKKIKNGNEVPGYETANFLDGYAEIGHVYVTKVKEMIISNKLYKYDNLQLD